MGPLTPPALVAKHSRVLSSSMITVITSTSTAAKGIFSTSSVALCREAGTQNTEREHAIQEQQFFGFVEASSALQCIRRTGTLSVPADTLTENLSAFGMGASLLTYKTTKRKHTKTTQSDCRRCRRVLPRVHADL